MPHIRCTINNRPVVFPFGGASIDDITFLEIATQFPGAIIDSNELDYARSSEGYIPLDVPVEGGWVGLYIPEEPE